MRSIREILRLSYDLKVSANEIHRITGASRGAIQNCISAAKEKSLNWASAADWDDKTLEEELFSAKRIIEPWLKQQELSMRQEHKSTDGTCRKPRDGRSNDGTDFSCRVLGLELF